MATNAYSPSPELNPHFISAPLSQPDSTPTLLPQTNDNIIQNRNDYRLHVFEKPQPISHQSSTLLNADGNLHSSSAPIIPSKKSPTNKPKFLLNNPILPQRSSTSGQPNYRSTMTNHVYDFKKPVNQQIAHFVPHPNPLLVNHQDFFGSPYHPIRPPPPIFPISSTPPQNHQTILSTVIQLLQALNY